MSSNENELYTLTKQYKVALENRNKLLNILDKNASPDEQSKLELAEKTLTTIQREIDKIKNI